MKKDGKYVKFLTSILLTPLRRAYTMKFFFHDLEIFISKEKYRHISESEMCVVKFIQFLQKIKFHSYDHDNVSFIERINNFHFSCHRYYSFKSCLKILKKRSQLCCYPLGSKLKHSSSSQLLFKDFTKLFSECAMFIRDRRNTN